MRRVNLNQRLWSVVAIIILSNLAQAQTTAFTYQGKLSTSGTPATGTYDFEFRLFDAASGGTQLGTTAQLLNVTVTAGIFTVQLDFGNQFNGAARFLDISVRAAGGGAFTLLAPRQQVMSNPYAIKSLNAATADGLSVACVSCVTSSQIQSVAGSAVTGTIPVASIPAGSANYIQNNPASQQTSSNFNISGNGTLGGTLSANAVTSATQFNIGASRVFSASSSVFNTFAGIGTGASSGFAANRNSFFGYGAGETNISGANNSFFGYQSGNANTAPNNSFFGSQSGLLNAGGTRNSFFGLSSGEANLSGNDNAFFGYRAGDDNSASENSFFGSSSGGSNTSGTGNSFFGYNAGAANTSGALNSFFGKNSGIISTGNSNSFFGWQSGFGNTTGVGNTFVGVSAGSANTTGDFITVVGWNAGVASNNLQFATAIGAGASVSENNTLVLGRSADKVKMSVLQITGGSDLAENFEISDEVKPGMIVAIDPQNAGTLVLARGAYNRSVAGVISGANNLSAGMVLPDVQKSANSLPVALSGRVWVYADATRQRIRPGDLLTTSATTAGYAMKVTNYQRAQGAIIGKAMTELKSGKGLILVLVSLQ